MITDESIYSITPKITTTLQGSAGFAAAWIVVDGDCHGDPRSWRGKYRPL